MIFQVKTRKIASQKNWISVTKLFKEGVSSILKELRLSYDDPRYEKYNERLNKLDSIKNYIYPVQVLPKHKDYAEVTEVFKRVNSSGTRLKGSDLALAQVTSRWPGSMAIFEDFVSECQREHFDLDAGFLIRCVVSLGTGQCKFSQLGKLSLEDIKEKWEDAKRGISYTINFLKGNAKIETSEIIPSSNLLVPIVCYSVMKEYKLDPKEENRLLKWFYAAAMWGRYARGSSETILNQDLVALRSENPCHQLLDNLIQQFGRIAVTEKDLREKQRNSPFFMMSYVLAKNKGAKDWRTGLTLRAKQIGKEFKVEQDHLFPRSKLDKFLRDKGYEDSYRKKLINEIANIGFLSRKANAIKSNELPIDYFPRVIKSRGNEAISCQTIPPKRELWEIERYEDFLRERRKLLADEINSFIESITKGQKEYKESTIGDIISNGESENVEFKSSMRWDYNLEKKNKNDLGKVIVKTISAFMNTFGGTLLIGIDDSGTVLGLEKDFSTFSKEKDQNEDGFERALTNLINKHIGKEFRKYAHVSFEQIDEKLICVVKVEGTPHETYVNVDGINEFYIRSGNASEKLDVKESTEYIKDHWK